LFAADYGIGASGKGGQSAVSLLSKYLYFATGYTFPLYAVLGPNTTASRGIADRAKRRAGFQAALRQAGKNQQDNGIPAMQLSARFCR
jgi:hypothetical protein